MSFPYGHSFYYDTRFVKSLIVLINFLKMRIFKIEVTDQGDKVWSWKYNPSLLTSDRNCAKLHDTNLTTLNNYFENSEYIFVNKEL